MSDWRLEHVAITLGGVELTWRGRRAVTVNIGLFSSRTPAPMVADVEAKEIIYDVNGFPALREKWVASTSLLRSRDVDELCLDAGLRRSGDIVD